MKKFLLELSQKELTNEEIPSEFVSLVEELFRLKILKKKFGKYKFDSRYKAGVIDISSNGTGFVKTLTNSHLKDLLVEAKDTLNASRGDIVIVKRLHVRDGRPKAKVVFIAKRVNPTSIVYTKIQHKRVVGVNIKNELVVDIGATQKSLKQLPSKTVLKIDNESGIITEVLGVLDDPSVDEKISLALFDKEEFFSKEAEIEAKAHGNKVEKSFYPNRVDLTHLDFCTIDPNDAKDFDDAIYFDKDNYILYVAIADVSEYLFDMGHIDKEARKRGFSIYFPHKSIPMLPRSLSEGICSLKPNEDRLAFTFKITLDKNTLKPLKEELLEAIIHSKRRYTYDEVDKFLAGDLSDASDVDKKILEFLLPLHVVTNKLRDIRLKDSFNFRTSEIRMELDEDFNLVKTKIESETPSHSLIEDCMLLANKAASKRLDFGVFRTHGEPSYDKIEKLLDDLAFIGIEVNFTPELPKLIREIQKKADALDIREDVDKLIIKAQQKAIYEPVNKGHFGLGFDSYTHFTSPIRRYSDLMLHRLLKADLKNETKRKKFLLKDIENVCQNISDLERQSDKVAWDFMDRKFARWANERVGEDFKAIITDNSKSIIAKLDDEIKGARLFLLDEDADLFDRVIVKIVESNIATARIYAKIVRRDV
ncbi:RNB domain-containing ribonuclease [Sulfurospirillum sp. 1307]